MNAADKLHEVGQSLWLEKAGVDVAALAAQLQEEGARSFVNSWKSLLAMIEFRSATLVG